MADWLLILCGYQDANEERSTGGFSPPSRERHEELLSLYREEVEQQG